METSISLRNCQPLPVPRQSRGFSRDNNEVILENGASYKIALDDSELEGKRVIIQAAPVEEESEE